MSLPQQRQRQSSCTNLLDGLARSVMSVDVPEARVCREVREQGRKDMRTLNEKLAAQLEKIRFLTEQNRKLSEQAACSNRSGRETERLRQTYDKELHQLRQLVDGCEKEKADTLAKMATLQQTLRSKQDHIQQLSDTNRKLTDQLEEALKECSVKDADKIVLQRRGKAAEEEAQRLRAALEQSKLNNQQLHTNLDEETAGRMGCQAEMQTLREEMEFMKRVHEQELEELRSLINADREQDEGHWREEMQKAIHDIQTEYDQRLEKIRKEMDINYSNRLAELSQAQGAQNARYQKLTDENAALANNLEAMRKRAEQLRAKCDSLEEALKVSQAENQALRKNLESFQREAERERRVTEDALNKALAELQALSDAKLNLESEIAAYRRLLEAHDSLFDDIGGSRKKSDTPSRPNGLRVRVPSYDSSPMSPAAPLSRSDIFARWMDREEPSGQSTKQQFIERKVEE